MPYFLEAHRRANKELAALPPAIADGIRRVLRDLAKDIHDGRFDLKPIQGHTSLPPTMRLRVGSYRVLLKVDKPGKRIVVLRVGHRSTVYQGVKDLDEGLGHRKL